MAEATPIILGLLVESSAFRERPVVEIPVAAIRGVLGAELHF